MASEGRSESSVSSRAQASSWERCMVPLGSRGADGRQRRRAGRRADQQAGAEQAGWGCRASRLPVLRGAGWVRSEPVTPLAPL